MTLWWHLSARPTSRRSTLASRARLPLYLIHWPWAGETCRWKFCVALNFWKRQILEPDSYADGYFKILKRLAFSWFSQRDDRHPLLSASGSLLTKSCPWKQSSLPTSLLASKMDLNLISLVLMRDAWSKRLWLVRISLNQMIHLGPGSKSIHLEGPAP